jgi:hypothetical protein
MVPCKGGRQQSITKDKAHPPDITARPDNVIR